MSLVTLPAGADVATGLGLLADLQGLWAGNGFSLVARPNGSGEPAFVLGLTATRETLEYTTIGGPVLNRGSLQSDIAVHGLRYLQHITDQATGTDLHTEPGLWIRVPPTEDPAVSGDTYVRQASVPQGNVLLAQSTTTATLDGAPIIEAVDSTPFTGVIPPLNASPQAALTDPLYLAPYRNASLPIGLPPTLDAAATVKDPTLALQATLAGQHITRTVTITISTTPVGGIVNIPFVNLNANATQLDAIFWIETVEDPVSGTFTQLQYVQRVVLDFTGIAWPHLAVATLRKQ